MVDVTTEILIERPAGEVGAYAANPDNVPHWYANITSVEWKTSKPLALGTQLAFKARFMGRELSYVYTVVDYRPGEKLVMRTSDGPFEMETSYGWREVGPRTTRMTLRNSGNPTGFSTLAVPFMTYMMRRENKKDLARLKAILEST